MNKTLEIFRKQKENFLKGETKNVDFRIFQLKKLKRIMKEHEEEILQALEKDLGKSAFESYATEIGQVYDEISLHIKNCKKWSKNQKRKAPIVHFPAKSEIVMEPYGVVLIIGPFNYPFQLVMMPLIGAISAGNCVMLKPSEYTPNVTKVIEKIINKNFNQAFLYSIDPSLGKEMVSFLLDLKFDYIFFTGSVSTGKIVMERAAKYLIPVTLELGGKSPCIVEDDCLIEQAARRIVWGKYLNAGQTCVAPDYLYVHKEIYQQFLDALVEEIKKQYGKQCKENREYTRIINSQTVERLAGYLKEGEVYYGGHYEVQERYFEPTILINMKKESSVMEEEIFGPILPVLIYDNLDEVITQINSKQKPLALYYFSRDFRKINKVLKSTSSGGVTINDTIVHAASSYLPFGGVGNSGMGSYHGKESFLTFSHKKGVMRRGIWMDIPVKYAPYGDKISILKKLMK